MKERLETYKGVLGSAQWRPIEDQPTQSHQSLTSVAYWVLRDSDFVTAPGWVHSSAVRLPIRQNDR